MSSSSYPAVFAAHGFRVWLSHSESKTACVPGHPLPLMCTHLGHWELCLEPGPGPAMEAQNEVCCSCPATFQGCSVLLEVPGASFIFSWFSMTALLSSWAVSWSFSPARKYLLVGVKVTRRTLGMTSRPPAVLLARGVWGKGRSTNFRVLSWRPWLLGCSGSLASLCDPRFLLCEMGLITPTLQVCQLDQGRSKCPAWALSMLTVSSQFGTSVSASRMGIPFSS